MTIIIKNQSGTLDLQGRERGREYIYEYKYINV